MAISQTVLNKKGLWLALTNYHFENIVPPGLMDQVVEIFGGTDASTRAFAAKIAKKKGWSVGFAMQAIAEYKKFVFLGMVSDSPVTPSKVIDDVWHQHLQFTRAYREFCEKVLGRNFDHSPELVPSSGQTEVFNAQYHDTLDLYRREFGQTPPENIWGRPKFDPRKVSHNRPVGMKNQATPSMKLEKGGDEEPLHELLEEVISTVGDVVSNHHSSVCNDITGGHDSVGCGDGGHGGDSGGSGGGGSSCSSGGGCSSGCGGGGD